MPRPRKPDNTNVDEVEPTLADIAKALTSLTSTVILVKKTLNDQIAKHEQEVDTNQQNHKDLKKELKDIIKGDLTVTMHKLQRSEAVNKNKKHKSNCSKKKSKTLRLKNAPPI